MLDSLSLLREIKKMSSKVQYISDQIIGNNFGKEITNKEILQCVREMAVDIENLYFLRQSLKEYQELLEKER